MALTPTGLSTSSRRYDFCEGLSSSTRRRVATLRRSGSNTCPTSPHPIRRPHAIIFRPFRSSPNSSTMHFMHFPFYRPSADTSRASLPRSSAGSPSLPPSRVLRTPSGLRRVRVRRRLPRQEPLPPPCGTASRTRTCRLDGGRGWRHSPAPLGVGLPDERSEKPCEARSQALPWRITPRFALRPSGSSMSRRSTLIIFPVYLRSIASVFSVKSCIAANPVECVFSSEVISILRSFPWIIPHLSTRRQGGCPLGRRPAVSRRSAPASHIRLSETPNRQCHTSQ